jgi:hypothetical protein
MKKRNPNSEIQIPNFPMYRRPKFLEVLHTIREQMSREVDYDVDLFAEMVRSGARPTHGPERIIRGQRTRAAAQEAQVDLDETAERPKKRAGKSR